VTSCATHPQRLDLRPRPAPELANPWATRTAAMELDEAPSDRTSGRLDEAVGVVFT